MILFLFIDYLLVVWIKNWIGLYFKYINMFAFKKHLVPFVYVCA